MQMEWQCGFSFTPSSIVCCMGPISVYKRSFEAGFPFDDIRSSSARSRLDDLASRHPMFSTMGSPNSWQDIGDMGRWGQRGRHNSGGAGSTCSSGAASGSSTASCGEEHVIPIKVVHTNSSSAEAGAERTAAPSNSNTNPDSGTPPEPPKRKQQPLGPQRSATDNNSYKKAGDGSSQGQGRSQRAQSAPPDGTAMGQTNAPQGTQLGGNSSKSKQNVGSGGVRHIPIFVEGRDSPVLPTEAPDTSPSQPNQSAPVFNSSPPKTSRPAEHSPTPPPKKPTPPKDPIEKVQAVSEEVKALEEKVKEFVGDSRKDKNYIYLDEMLTRNLIKLDDIETEGRDDIRTARKDCIKLINSCIALLEAKITPPVTGLGTQMEVEEAGSNANVNEENLSKEHITTVEVTGNPSDILPAENSVEAPKV